MEPLHHHQEPTAAEAPAEIQSISRAEHQRLFQRGLKWLGAGIFFMAVSFGINFLLFHSDTSFETTMYILTSLGAICITKGLVDMLGF